MFQKSHSNAGQVQWRKFVFQKSHSNAGQVVTGLTALPPIARRLILVGIDAVLISLAVWLSFWLRLAQPFHISFLAAGEWLLTAAVLIGLPVYAFTGQYKGLTRYVGSSALYRLAGRNALLVLMIATVGVILRMPMPPRTSWFLLWLLITGFTGALRFLLRDLIISLRSINSKKITRVAIYGAGEAGTQLAAALRLTGNHMIISFLDDAPGLWNRSINNVPIKPSNALSNLNGKVDQVLLAIPSLGRNRRRFIVDQLQQQSIPVLQIPSVDDITSGRARIDSLSPVAIEDLLGRDPVPPDPNLLGPGISGSVVCVIGAGGSIGSELCRQIMKLHPAHLILLERNEPSLYAIDHELRYKPLEGVVLQPVLGCATDVHLVKKIFMEAGVHVAFHAAAYKHVPMVELNPLAGLANNVLSTRVVCSAAVEAGLRQVVFISTDKAVRPTNVMGSSKRLAELVVQANAEEASVKDSGSPLPIFSMVRFGNVLGSSGSVVPLFRRQIKAGGPITLTHPDIIRYFMTIPEAAQLVIQASVLSEGGDVFLLDMGEPVRIKALAEQMVRLSGLSLHDSNNPQGDIEIVYTGLRPGEKLYEELLIEAKSESTLHPLIFRGQERSIQAAKLWPKLDALQASIERQDQEAALDLLAELVPEWKRETDNLPVD